jgi:hypothetical protein
VRFRHRRARHGLARAKPEARITELRDRARRLAGGSRKIVTPVRAVAKRTTPGPRVRVRRDRTTRRFPAVIARNRRKVRDLRRFFGSALETRSPQSLALDGQTWRGGRLRRRCALPQRPRCASVCRRKLPHDMRDRVVSHVCRGGYRN